MGSSNYPPIPPPGGGTPQLPGQGQPKPLQPGEYGATSSPTVATFDWEKIPPSGGLYVNRNDTLLITVYNSAIGQANLDIHLRILLASPTASVPGQPDSPSSGGAVNPISNSTLSLSQSYPLLQTRAPQQFVFPLQEGLLTVLGAAISPAFSRKGQTHVTVILQRGESFLGGQSGQLFSGYVCSPTSISWPGTSPVYPTDGAGWLHSVNLGNPAAGAEILFTVPFNARWRMRSFAANYSIANSGIARTHHIQIKDASGNLVYQAAAQQTAAINQPVVVSASPGGNLSTADTQTINLPLPGDTILSQGFTIGTFTSQIVAPDQYSAIWAQVEEWIEP
jgi:hypothetical protein